MKIVFLCSSLEPGRDGVGDYTRKLGGELTLLGHQINIIALNDRFVYEQSSEIHSAANLAMPVLRLPSDFSIRKRYSAAKSYVKKFDPDWISLQYVPFGFQKKGLPFFLGIQLKRLGKSWRWQIMFHELWVGMDKEASSKDILWGYLQKLLIARMIGKLEPGKIHTQSHLYQQQLAKLGFKCNYLPLFSNIPVAKNFSISTPYEKQEKNTFVIFGNIHPGAPVSLFAKELAAVNKRNGIKTNFTFIGRCGKEMQHWIAQCNLNQIEVEVKGEMSAEMISEMLSKASFGISTTPIALVEKSGSVAAMLAHKLPVISVARPWLPRDIDNIFIPEGIYEYKPNALESFLNLLYTALEVNDVSKVASSFVNDLASVTYG